MLLKSLIILFIIQILNGYHLTSALPTSSKNLSPHIIGGTEAPDGYAKHMVALVAGVHIRFLTCGASIVSRRHVLSAAHCLEPYVTLGELSPQLNGVIGSNNWRSNDNVIRFSDHIIHPDYCRPTIKNDIAVLFTDEDIQYSDKIQPISLNFNWISNGGGFVTGWGLTSTDVQIVDHEGQIINVRPDRLQILYVKTISSLKCIIGVRNASISWGSNGPWTDPSLEICTFHSIGHGMCNSCNYDGCPCKLGYAMVHLVVSHYQVTSAMKQMKAKDVGHIEVTPAVLEGSGEQIGIVSWGFPCAIGAPDVFVRVSAFKDFLMPIVGAEFNL